MTDSRAALEEAAEKLLGEIDAIAREFDSYEYGLPLRKKTQVLRTMADAVANFYEQESSSLKLLLRAMCNRGCHLFNGNTEISIYPPLSDSPAKRRTFPIELDSSGIPVLTQEIVEALEATK